MSIVNCPQCNKKISDKAKSCPHCQVDTDMDEEKRERLAAVNRAQTIKSLSTQSMMALILALAGFYVMYFQNPEPESIQLLLSQVAFGAGFIWYVGVRIRHFMLKHMGK